ncbi:MAG: LLM class flavin-dependent oxidoreductase [Dehalococcoidia bacterium]
MVGRRTSSARSSTRCARVARSRGRSAGTGYAGRGFEPSPRPDTELWVGGNGAVAHARTVRYGSGWQPTGLSPEDVRSGMEQVRRLAEEAGRDPTGISCGLRLRVRVLPETYRSELPGLFESYLAAGVTDFLCEINTRERAYTLEAIANLVESFRLAGVDVRA